MDGGKLGGRLDLLAGLLPFGRVAVPDRRRGQLRELQRPDCGQADPRHDHGPGQPVPGGAQRLPGLHHQPGASGVGADLIRQPDLRRSGCIVVEVGRGRRQRVQLHHSGDLLPHLLKPTDPRTDSAHLPSPGRRGVGQAGEAVEGAGYGDAEALGGVAAQCLEVV